MSCAEFTLLHIKTGEHQSEFSPRPGHSCIPFAGLSFVRLTRGKVRKLSLSAGTEKLSSLSREIVGT